MGGWVLAIPPLPQAFWVFFCFLEVYLIYVGLTLVLPYNRPPACFGFFFLVSFLSPVFFQRFFFRNVFCSFFVFLLPSNVFFHDFVVVQHYLSAFTGAGQHFLQEPYFRANTNIRITKLNNSLIKRLEKISSVFFVGCTFVSGQVFQNISGRCLPCLPEGLPEIRIWNLKNHQYKSSFSFIAF